VGLLAVGILAYRNRDLREFFTQGMEPEPEPLKVAEVHEA
jgi:hypothetical protein